MSYFSGGAGRTYKSEVKYGLDAFKETPGTVTEEDIRPLPEPLQKYLRYTGAVGKPGVWNFRAVAEGRMTTSAEGRWMKMNTWQYNFIKNPTRLYYLKASMFGIPCYGLHSYKGQTGSMLVKVLGLVPVVNGKGKEMDEGDCVTLFNDMCLVAPASLTDKRITWEAVDSLTAKATFHNGPIDVSAMLFFNDTGELINFESDDRYYSTTGATYTKLKWSTPLRDYRDFGGIRLASHVDAVWTMPGGKQSTYGEFDIRSVEYNLNEFK